MAPKRVVIVGASLAGLRAAESLRRAGFDEELAVIGEEPHLPYNRPPLSKEALDGLPDPAELCFRLPRTLDGVTWRTGETVVAADFATHTVSLAQGERLHWDGLVAATGLRPRRLALAGPTGGRHVLRTLDDARALRAVLRPGAHLVIIGAGFIGCELAATARRLGLEADVVAPEPVPMQRPLGLELGAALQRRHEQAGVRFHLGTLPRALAGRGRVEMVELADGKRLAADVVVEAIGCTPNVEWLSGNGLDLSDGVRCDGWLRAGGRPDVVACGDVARFPNALFDDEARRVEHWTMTNDTGRRAGTSLGRWLTGQVEDPTPFAPIPSFWSDQYDWRLQSFGSPGLGGDDVRVLEGDPAGEVAVGYHRGGRLVGVILVGLGPRHAYYRRLVAAEHGQSAAA
jgi:3-phenylpropionate/trans-cinnamate dioxygenase ferredoxin reductase subunit